MAEPRTEDDVTIDAVAARLVKRDLFGLRAAQAAEEAAEAKQEELELAEMPTAEVTETEVEPEAKVEGEDADVTQDTDVEDTTEETTEDTTEEDGEITSLDQLAQYLEADRDQILELKIATKIDGEESEVPLSEILKSYQLSGHVNRKSQEVAERAKALDKEVAEAKAAYEAQRKDAAAMLETTKKMLVGQYENVNLDQMFEEDPDNASRVKYRMERDFQLLNDQVAAYNEQANRDREAQQVEHNKYLAEQQENLVKYIPAWTDSKVRATEQSAMADYLRGIPGGFTDEELNGLTDARYAYVIRKAMKFDALQKSKPSLTKRVKAAPKTLKASGSGVTPNITNAKLKAAREKFQRTGSTDDLAALRILKRQLR